MKARAHIFGHPVHPMLVGFPITFVTSGVVADAVSAVCGCRGWWEAASWLWGAAVVTGLAAGAAGLADYVGVVPPNSSAKSRATTHMLLNILILAYIGLMLASRRGWNAEPGLVWVLTDLMPLGVLVYSGWLGGTLSYRNQIGVDHRYAEAGKWREEHIEAEPGRPVKVASDGDLEVNQMKLLHIKVAAGQVRRVVLARSEMGYVAFDDHCSHKGGPLSDGVMINGTVSCPWHGSQFDCRTGAVKAGPAEAPVQCFKAAVQGRDVVVTL